MFYITSQQPIDDFDILTSVLDFYMIQMELQSAQRRIQTTVSYVHSQFSLQSTHDFSNEKYRGRMYRSAFITQRFENEDLRLQALGDCGTSPTNK